MLKRSLIIALLLFLTLCGTAFAQSEDEELYGLEVLPTLDDMPYGFYQEWAPARNGSNREVASDFNDPMAMEDELNTLGRLGGFSVYFGNSLWPGRDSWDTKKRSTSNSLMMFEILTFDSLEGAGTYYESILERETQRSNNRTVKRISGPQIEPSDGTIHLFTIPQGDEDIHLWDTVTQVDRHVLFVRIWANRGSADLDQLFEAAEMFTEKVVADLSN